MVHSAFGNSWWLAHSISAALWAPPSTTIRCSPFAVAAR